MSAFDGVHAHTPVFGHRRGEQVINAVDFTLQKAVCFTRDGCVRVEIVFAVTGKDGGVGNTVLLVFDRLVDVHGNHANGAHTTGARDDQAAGCTGQRIGSGERHVVGNSPDWFDGRGRANAIRQIEHARGFATGRVNIEHDGCNIRVGQRCIQCHGNTGVTGQTGLGFKPLGAPHQRAINGNHGNARLTSAGIRLGSIAIRWCKPG